MADQPRTTESTVNLLLNAMGKDARAALLAKSRRSPGGAMTVGNKLGAYEIIAKLGEGGPAPARVKGNRRELRRGPAEAQETR